MNTNKTPFDQATELMEHLCLMVEAQNNALKIALQFIGTVGQWGLPYSSEALTANDRINEELAKVKLIEIKP
jgi:hypothetical protein